MTNNHGGTRPRSGKPLGTIQPKRVAVSIQARLSFTQEEYAKIVQAFELEPDGCPTLNNWVAVNAHSSVMQAAGLAIGRHEDNLESAEAVRETLAELLEERKLS